MTSSRSKPSCATPPSLTEYDATADYLHRYFEPTARAIDGLEKALAGLGRIPTSPRTLDGADDR